MRPIQPWGMLSQKKLAIRLVTAPFFLATKIEAFQSRGAGDYIASHDMEDIISLLDGRPEIVDEVGAAREEVRAFLSQRFRDFLLNREFLDALPGHLMPDQASQQRIPMLMGRIKALAELGG